jgi:hypothetical protein
MTPFGGFMTKRLFLAALMAVFLLIPKTGWSQACAPRGSEAQIPTLLQAFYDGLARDDRKVWQQIVDRSFYAYDASQRLDGNALFEMLEKAHHSGIRIAWHLDEINVQPDCTTAWFTLMNRGSIGDAGGSQPMTWQESGVFTWRDGQWKLTFFHSNRVQAKS